MPIALAPMNQWVPPMAYHEISVRNECVGQAAVVIEPISAGSLRKTGNFAATAGDFRRFDLRLRETGSLETKLSARKARISGLHLRQFESPG